MAQEALDFSNTSNTGHDSSFQGQSQASSLSYFVGPCALGAASLKAVAHNPACAELRSRGNRDGLLAPFSKPADLYTCFVVNAFTCDLRNIISMAEAVSPSSSMSVYSI